MNHINAENLQGPLTTTMTTKSEHACATARTGRAKRLLAVAVATVAAGLMAVHADAATQTWDTVPGGAQQSGAGDWWDGVTGAPGDANAGKNWTGGVAGAWVQGNDANFPNLGGGAAYFNTVNLIGAVQANSITQSGVNTNTTISGAGTMHLIGPAGINNSGGPLTINTKVIMSSSQTWAVSGLTVIAGKLEQAGAGFSLTKNLGSTLNLRSGDNDYTGATVINGGTLLLSHDGTIKQSPSLTIGLGATGRFDYSGAGYAGVDRLADAAPITLSGTLDFVGNADAQVSETIGAVALDAGATAIILRPDAAQHVRVSAASLTRAGSATLTVRGPGFGQNALASATAGAGNISLVAEPVFTGSAATSGTATRILPWAVGDDFTTTTVLNPVPDFLTYDATSGLRRLVAGEYLTTLTDGHATADNVRFGDADVALSSPTLVNSLSLINTPGTPRNATNINGATTLTVQSGGILTFGDVNIGTANAGTLDFGAAEAIFHTAGDTASVANVGSSIVGTGGLTKTGARLLILSGSNGYSGVTTVNQGTLQVGANGTTGDLGSSSGIVLAGGNVDFRRSNAFTVSNISGQLGSVIASGSGTMTLAGANNLPGALTVRGGGDLIVTGTTTAAGTVGLESGTASIGSGTTLSANALTVGALANNAGALYQTGGAVTSQGTGDPSFTIGNAANGYGFYALDGGTLNVVRPPATSRTRIATATNAVGALYQTGGSFSTGNFDVGQSAGAQAVYYMTGGTYTGAAALGIGMAANAAQVTIAGTAVATQSGSITLGNVTNATAVLNLNAGGTLQTGGLNSITTSGSAPGTGVRHFNFNGGTLRHTAGSATQMVGSANYTANVFAGGAAFDVVNSNAVVTIAQPLVAPAGDGVAGTTYAIASGGSGYVGAPVVTITGATGATGATAVANMVDDGSGNGTFKVASVTVTSPGINASSPSFTFGSVPGATAATPVALSTTANLSGGITKVGLGTLSLNAVNTYTGSTTVMAGKLALGAAGSIDSSSGVVVKSGATFDTSAKTGYVVNGLAGAGTVVVGNTKTLTLNAADALAPGDSAGTLTITSGNLALATGTEYDFEVDGTTASPVNDRVNLTGTASTVTFAGDWTLNLANLGTVDPTGLEFVLFDAVAAIAGVGNWAIDYGTTGWTGGQVLINPSDSTQVILSGLEATAAVPEPTTLAMLGLGATGLLARRRRAVR